MKHFYCLAIFLLFACTAAAQGLPGYLITWQNDTLRGSIIEYDQCVRLQTANDKPAFYTPTTARGYGIGRQQAFVSRPVHLATGHDSLRFTQLQLDGAASLYSGPHDHALLLRPAGRDTLYELTATTWHLLLHQFISDCAGFVQSTPAQLAKSFSTAEVRSRVRAYNRCRGPVAGSETARYADRGWVLGGGVSAGTQHLYLRYNRVPVSSQSTQPGKGNHIGLSILGMRANGLQLLGSLDFGRLQAKSYEFRPYVRNPYAPEESLRNFYQYDRLTAGLTLAKLLNMRHHVHPFFGFGLASSLQFNIQKEVRITSAAETRWLTPKSPAGIQPFVLGQAGLWVQTNRIGALRFSAQYQWGYINNLDTDISSTSLLGVQVGYFFYSRATW